MADPAFQRAPILRKLLCYLRDETLQADRRSLSQFAIAVDGLGRSEDYDKATESYPRVQISRLRKALAEYYQRNLPGEGVCVFLRRGDYTLHVAPLEVAYPEFLTVQAGAASSDLNEGAKPPEQPSRARIWRIWKAWPVRGALAFTVIGLILLNVVLFSDFFARSLTSEGAIVQAPIVALNIEGIDRGGGARNEAESDKVRLLERAVRNAIMFSPFSRMGAPDSAHYDDAQYVVGISFEVQPSGDTEGHLSFSDVDGGVLFTGVFSLSEDRDSLIDTIDNLMVRIFSLKGVLAHDLYRKMDGGPKSDFECFVLTDSGGAPVEEVQLLRRGCLERYPDSPLAAYWHTAMSFYGYINEVRDGGQVSKSGRSWAELESAFKLDQYNVPANVLAGKVGLAQGDCAYARYYWDRVSTRVYLYPALMGVVLGEVYPCGVRSGTQKQWDGQIEKLVANNPNPDSGVKPYLVMDALILGRRDLAKSILSAEEIGGAESERMSRGLELLGKAVEDVDYARRHRQDVEALISQFIWNPESRQLIMDRLTNP